jgi:hypothetical protein
MEESCVFIMEVERVLWGVMTVQMEHDLYVQFQIPRDFECRGVVESWKMMGRLAVF